MKLSLDEFKQTIAEDESLKARITSKNDVIDIDNGTMMIYRQNLPKYLEQYMCRDEEDLENTLWYAYGVYAKILD